MIEPNIVGLMCVRNEEWILPLSLSVALKWCDYVVVLLHSCEDKTPEIVRDWMEPERRIRVISEHGDWDEMRHRQRMLEVARHLKPTHIAMIDADEVLTANLVPSIRGLVAAMHPEGMLLLPGFNLRRETNYHLNGVWGNRWFSGVFRDRPALGWSGDQFHQREPLGGRFVHMRALPHHKGGILHYWGYDAVRLEAKHALYKVTERIRYPQKPVEQIDQQYNVWRSAADVVRFYKRAEPIWSYASVPQEWLSGIQPDLLHSDGPALWQTQEVRRLVHLHGAAAFAGLDLFGVV